MPRKRFAVRRDVPQRTPKPPRRGPRLTVDLIKKIRDRGVPVPRSPGIPERVPKTPPRTFVPRTAKVAPKRVIKPAPRGVRVPPTLRGGTRGFPGGPPLPGPVPAPRKPPRGGIIRPGRGFPGGPPLPGPKRVPVPKKRRTFRR